MADLQSLSREELERMREAGAHTVECYRILQKSGANIVGELLRGAGTFYEWDHYPKGDIYDSETHSQYYYHAHPSENRTGLYGPEHGHFHTFLRPKGMPESIRPAPLPDYAPPEDPDNALSHLIAVSMDRAGFPIRLFTTNRWVTGEVWYAAEDVIGLLDRFEMDVCVPSWPVNIWLSAMVRLFKPQISVLLHERDAAVSAWQVDHPDGSAYEDRELEVTSFVAVSVADQIAAVDAALKAL
jgi:hypothetical protein